MCCIDQYSAPKLGSSATSLHPSLALGTNDALGGDIQNFSRSLVVGAVCSSRALSCKLFILFDNLVSDIADLGSYVEVLERGFTEVYPTIFI